MATKTKRKRKTKDVYVYDPKHDRAKAAVQLYGPDRYLMEKPAWIKKKRVKITRKKSKR